MLWSLAGVGATARSAGPEWRQSVRRWAHQSDETQIHHLLEKRPVGLRGSAGCAWRVAETALFISSTGQHIGQEACEGSGSWGPRGCTVLSSRESNWGSKRRVADSNHKTSARRRHQILNIVLQPHRIRLWRLLGLRSLRCKTGQTKRHRDSARAGSDEGGNRSPGCFSQCVLPSCRSPRLCFRLTL